MKVKDFEGKPQPIINSVTQMHEQKEGAEPQDLIGFQEDFGVPVGERNRVRNLVSLEVSDEVDPKVYSFGSALMDANAFKNYLGNYLLGSEDASYTQIHVDFARSGLGYAKWNDDNEGTKSFFATDDVHDQFNVWYQLDEPYVLVMCLYMNLKDPLWFDVMIRRENWFQFANLKALYAVRLKQWNAIICPNGTPHLVTTHGDTGVAGFNALWWNTGLSASFKHQRWETQQPLEVVPEEQRIQNPIHGVMAQLDRYFEIFSTGNEIEVQLHLEEYQTIAQSIDWVLMNDDIEVNGLEWNTQWHSLNI